MCYHIVSTAKELNVECVRWRLFCWLWLWCDIKFLFGGSISPAVLLYSSIGKMASPRYSTACLVFNMSTSTVISYKKS